MKSSIAIIASLIMLFSLAHGQDNSLTIGSVAVSPFQRIIQVPVYLNTGEGICGVDGTIGWTRLGDDITFNGIIPGGNGWEIKAAENTDANQLIFHGQKVVNALLPKVLVFYVEFALKNPLAESFNLTFTPANPVIFTDCAAQRPLLLSLAMVK